jgi:hypothetical protein
MENSVERVNLARIQVAKHSGNVAQGTPEGVRARNGVLGIPEDVRFDDWVKLGERAKPHSRPMEKLSDLGAMTRMWPTKLTMFTHCSHILTRSQKLPEKKT